MPTMRDRAMQALYLLALDPIAETTADPNSYGFRPGRSTADAIEQCFTALGNRQTAEWVLEGDIKACFDRISHDWLLAHVPMDKAMLQKWLKAGFMDKRVLYPTDEGTPQGGIISPVLANLALDGLERELRERYPKGFVKGGQKLVNLVRYADDFIITGRTKELLEGEVKPLVETFLRARGLELSQEKTSITHIEDGFDFLGQNVRKYGGKLIIKPSRKNVQAFLQKVRGKVKANKQATAANLIHQLNPVLRGWVTFHRHAVDHALFVCLWRWALRRHSNKGTAWVRKKYFRTIRGRQWRFFGEKTKPDGTTGKVGLFYPGNMAIQRHVKVKGQANPYDPNWELYFEQRLGVKMSRTLKGRRQLLYLWKEQGGICPVCNDPITELTGWHNHHIVWRSKGGADRAENRVLLHTNCHSQVHVQGLTVVKPRPARGE
jgi:RNA-directed DNA polymerase